ncbi:M50 family metallopeptidase [Actinomadura madurae]|uniref:M50 family metallopeptidase n=1 Tax=Actinomadura madurae TaxID=1993 RepID=UPI0020D22E5A|nr:site-2 protease family protein [Actinomadura madurae]MCP9970469.1 site-2 protease family protein [Actinomadura madurae]MCQ0019183.1 site-2 protease family protein [Actinomadura madurae]
MVYYLAGALILFFGLLVSIALHELGHFSFAKLFKVRTTQFMVGFGPTMWSRHRGETEYGVKWIPLGGYIRMIGMLPPRKGDAPGQVRRVSTGPWQGLIENARGAALEEVGPGDEDRVFYAKKWWQKLLIMFGGPAMNLLLSVMFFAILLMGIGTNQPQPVIKEVAECMVPASSEATTCPADAAPTPARQVGLQPGDRIVAFDGQKIDDYAQLQKLIRGDGGQTVPMTVQRDGRELALNVPITRNQMYDLEDEDKVVNVGFLGITPDSAIERQGPGAVASTMGDLTARTTGALLRMPQKMVGVWNAAFGGDERDPNGPIGVVGVSRIGGEVAASEDFSGMEKVSFFVMLLGSLNLAVGLFNLVPLLPLDGGHIAARCWRRSRRRSRRSSAGPTPATWTSPRRCR